jgi:VIT1/CCC1 family predicted Fe2+/Mn2+ transporter
MFDRGRLFRLGQAIADADEQGALDIVAGELDDTLAPISSEHHRLELYRDVVTRVRTSQRTPPTMTWADARVALAVFCLVFFASLPAALPYFVIHDSWIALRVSNALLIGMLFWVGYSWASHTSFHPLRFGILLTGLGVLLVLIAIPLGG